MTLPLVKAIERFLLPNACVVCDRLIEGHRPDGLLCGLCRARLRFVPPGCDRCGQPRPPVGPCRFCVAWPPAIAWVRSAVWLDDTARPLVHHLKYQGLPAIAAEMASVMARRASPTGRAFLVPIPLASGRLRDRGYNQAAAIARALGEIWKTPVADHLLARTRDTGTQTALTPEARARNVAGAFVAPPAPSAHSNHPILTTPAAFAVQSPEAWGNASGPAVILVDDVLTTGATLVAAATALATAGWPSIGAVTFARALPYERRAAG